MIESMEQTPDLTITFLSGKKVVVKDDPDTLIKNIISYRQQLQVTKQEL